MRETSNAFPPSRKLQTTCKDLSTPWYISYWESKPGITWNFGTWSRTQSASISTRIGWCKQLDSGFEEIWAYARPNFIKQSVPPGPLLAQRCTVTKCKVQVILDLNSAADA
ncbi:hypothetical protein DSO57_1025119 [Entomophthora muscae]|uniref:Uncharacterized protein n=1 Tax=Entomophthora muscae TaxID=34485 RepID=A0ACC2RH71_9FUNG|nr:hypothetical protein DSO57_1025119 [Entomophthora muscae]